MNGKEYMLTTEHLNSIRKSWRILSGVCLALFILVIVVAQQANSDSVGAKLLAIGFDILAVIWLALSLFLLARWVTKGRKENKVQYNIIDNIGSQLAFANSNRLPQLDNNEWSIVVISATNKTLQPLVPATNMESVVNDVREELAGATGKTISPEEGAVVVQTVYDYLHNNPQATATTTI